MIDMKRRLNRTTIECSPELNIISYIMYDAGTSYTESKQIWTRKIYDKSKFTF